MELINQLIWSGSRLSTYSECAKKYYYTYYGSWNGWKFDATDDQKELYLLKNLKIIQIITGSIVHEVVDTYLKAIKNNLSKPDAISLFEKKFNDFLQISITKAYRQRPKLGGIIEHEYNTELSQETINDEIEKGKTCLKNFLKSEQLKNILLVPSDNWMFSPGFCKCDVNGFEAFTMFDFAYEEDGKIIIIDFKTGKQESFEGNSQAQAYAYYFWKKYDKKPEDIVFLFWHLPSDEIIEKKFTLKTFEEFEDMVKKDMLLLQSKVDDLEENTTSEKNFEQTQEIVYCRYCQFRRYCYKTSTEVKNGKQT